MRTLSIGQVVQVSDSYHWAKGALGTVSVPPEPVKRLAGDWSGCVRHVKNRQGILPYYWVEFNEPQLDSDGDGPYAGGEIEASYLLPGA
jgi:hypothetical protein